MKKFLFITLILTFTITVTNAQVMQKAVPAPKQNVIIKTMPGQPAPPPANNPPAPANTTPYYLTAARVSITTGNDNKEQLSRASMNLATADGGCYPSDRTTGGCGMYDYNLSTRVNNEYKVNSVTDISMTTSYQFPYTFPGGVGEGWRYVNLSLAGIQKYGVVLYINYDPNFILDAWKIEKVTLTLEFKDLQGNAHPTLGTVVIPFMNASALLNNGNRSKKLEADKFLLPKS